MQLTLLVVDKHEPLPEPPVAPRAECHHLWLRGRLVSGRLTGALECEACGQEVRLTDL